MTERKRLLMVFGTRPEAIKMAPLYHALRADDAFELKLCVTAQHRQMMDQVLGLFDIVPDIDLSIMKPGQDLFDVTSAILLGLRDQFAQWRPDLVLVHGDTSTTLAGAMAAFYADIPVAHVEAGLRTHDMRAPFPEEFNRQVVSKIAAINFAPTDEAARNLREERVDEGRIVVTGNTVIDALLQTLDRMKASSERLGAIDALLDAALQFPWRERPFVLVTGHRRENFGTGFEEICRALVELAGRHPTVEFVYPVHLNPNVRTPVNAILNGRANVRLVEPLEYEPFVRLLEACRIVLTDSGGIQEEAPSLGKPVLVMRDVTERPEAVAAGTVRLVGANAARIVAEVDRLLLDRSAYDDMARAHNPYGDGRACDRIVEFLRSDR